MKPKNLISLLLFAFVAVSVGFLIAKDWGSDHAALQGDDRTTSATPVATVVEAMDMGGQEVKPDLIAYYFHQTQRCKTCLTIETYAKEALRDGFPDAWKTGRIAWRLVNIELPENEHFVDDYQLASSTLVLVPADPGKADQWRKLERVWELVGDELKFKAYVQAQAMMLLENQS